MTPIRIALVGIGKIALDQHVPALAADSDFELIAAVSRHHKLDEVANYPSLEAMLEARNDVDAVSICTPPQVRFDIAHQALESGLHVMLEKPPGATLNEVEALRELAATRGVSLYATWHSRAAAGVEPARDLLRDEVIRSVRIDWKEDVRVWHPGQTWIWKAGGLGVFDPGINALSVITHILPETLRIREALLSFPRNCETPIAAQVEMTGSRGAPVSATFDFLFAGGPMWQIEVAYGDDRHLRLSRGGAVLAVGNEAPITAVDQEYPGLYRHFAAQVRAGQSDVDTEPLRLVADAFMCGRRETVADFIE